MAKRRRRLFQPRFFVFLIAAAVLLTGIILLSSLVVDKIKEAKARESLTLPQAVNPIATTDPDATADPNATATPAIGVIATPNPLSESAVYTVSAAESAISTKTGFTTEIRINNLDAIYSDYSGFSSLSFPYYSKYSTTAGVTTFGGNNYRNSFSYGTVTVAMQKLSSVWTGSMGSLGGFAGASWTGQPLIVQWNSEVLPLLGVSTTYKSTEGFTEVIYPSADGNIYFYELTTGSQTRTPINVGVSLMGTATLDPTGLPMLYVGQGVQAENSRGNLVSYVYAVNLITNQVCYTFGGKDYFSLRDDWCAYDSSPLIINDTIFMPCETGVLYTIKLNTKMDWTAGTISIDPGDRIKLRYKGSGYSSTSETGKRWYGFESSAAAFRNYLYLADNGGRLMCIDINNMTLQFVVDLGGDTDATPVIEEDGAANTAYLYTANQTMTQDASLPSGFGVCTVRKINALTGAVAWAQTQVCYVGDGTVKSGCRSTPHIGHGQIGNLLICSFYGAGLVSTAEDGTVSYSYGGRIVAYDRSSGAIVWSIDQQGDADYLSSPLVVYTEAGAAYLIACDRAGGIKLYNAVSGTLLDSFDTGSRIDATPAAFGNYIVIATCGSVPKVYGLKIS